MKKYTVQFGDCPPLGEIQPSSQISHRVGEVWACVPMFVVHIGGGWGPMQHWGISLQGKCLVLGFLHMGNLVVVISPQDKSKHAVKFRWWWWEGMGMFANVYAYCDSLLGAGTTQIKSNVFPTSRQLQEKALNLAGNLLSSGLHWLSVMLSRAQGAVAPMAAAPITSLGGGMMTRSFGGAAFLGTTTGRAGGRAL